MYITDGMRDTALDVLRMLQATKTHIYWNGAAGNPGQAFAQKVRSRQVDCVPKAWVADASDAISSASMLWNGESEAQFLTLVMTAQLMGWSFGEEDEQAVVKLDDALVVSNMLYDYGSDLDEGVVSLADLPQVLADKVSEVLPHRSLDEVAAIACDIVADDECGDVIHGQCHPRGHYPVDLCEKVVDAFKTAVEEASE